MSTYNECRYRFLYLVLHCTNIDDWLACDAEYIDALDFMVAYHRGDLT